MGLNAFLVKAVSVRGHFELFEKRQFGSFDADEAVGLHRVIEFREESIVPKTIEKDGCEKQTTELKKTRRNK